MQALEQYRPASVACALKIIQCLRNRPGDIAWYYAEGFFRFVADVEEHADLIASALLEGLGTKDATIREMARPFWVNSEHMRFQPSLHYAMR